MGGKEVWGRRGEWEKWEYRRMRKIGVRGVI
jgi:hypothetical protein